MRNEIQQLNIRRQEQEQISQNVNWRSVLAAKELLDDDSNYRLPIGLTFFSLVRIIFTLFILSHSKERNQFISIFTSVGLFNDLLEIFYNYFLFRQIQSLKKQLYSHQFTYELLEFMNEIENKDLSIKYKSSLVFNSILKTNSFLRYFGRIIKVFSWALFIYSIFMIAFTDVLQDVSGISIPLIVIFTFNHYCIITVVMALSFYQVFFNILTLFKNITNIIKTRLNKYKIQKLIQKLPCQQYESIQDKASITCCAVCLVDYTSGDQVLQLNCSTQHHFHKECILQWLDIKSNCPICRKLVFESAQNPTHQPSANLQTSNNNTMQQLEQLLSNSSQQSQQEQSQSLNHTICNDQQNQLQQSNEAIRQKSKSDSSTPSAQNLQKIVDFIQQLKQNQQFLNDIKTQSPNQQIIDMIEENLSQQELSAETQEC
ncbi:hypothetical protein ABPG74_005290 [Tetrahymena malaccensis]